MNVTAKRAALLTLLALSACQSPKETPVVYVPEPEPEVEAPPPAPDAEYVRVQRMLADLLYSARIAVEDNRLMTPAGNNAYEIYGEVLRLDPGNAVAVQGIEEIARRYIGLADTALGKGQYDQAETLLARSARIDAQSPALQEARQRLAKARETRVETYALDPAGLSAQSLEMMNTLAQIAQDIMAREATFLINARTDAEGRWIYKVMREAVGGYRLRGNIDIGSPPAVLVSLPNG
ncbi:MAG TPA: tetratricopeptide repeat protein [Hyphomicrobiales bacterium]|nr:tetratricopeptide repeat protein [Hyphomicrobiales bacterium]